MIEETCFKMFVQKTPAENYTKRMEPSNFVQWLLLQLLLHNVPLRSRFKINHEWLEGIMLRIITNLLAIRFHVLCGYRGRSYLKQVEWATNGMYNDSSIYMRKCLKRNFQLAAIKAAEVTTFPSLR